MNTFLCLLALAVCATAAPTVLLEQLRPEPVPILKQINQVNDDGSYTFGFEAGDGSFRVETKTVDGQTIGKYGYIDEFGVQQVTDYVSGKKLGFQPSGSAPTPVIQAPSAEQRALDFEYSSVDEDEDGIPDYRPAYKTAYQPAPAKPYVKEYGTYSPAAPAKSYDSYDNSYDNSNDNSYDNSYDDSYDNSYDEPVPVVPIIEPVPVVRVVQPQPVVRVVQPQPVVRVVQPEPFVTVEDRVSVNVFEAEPVVRVFQQQPITRVIQQQPAIVPVRIDPVVTVGDNIFFEDVVRENIRAPERIVSTGPAVVPQRVIPAGPAVVPFTAFNRQLF